MKSKLLVLLLIVASAVPAFAHAQDDVVTVEFWHTYNEVSPENQMLVDTLIPMFEAEYPNIKVESVPFPYGEFRQTILTALAGGEGPEQKVLDRTLAGFIAQAQKSRQHVHADRQHFQADENHDEVGGADHHHAAEYGG